MSVLVVHTAAVTVTLVGLKRGTSRVMAGGCIGRTYGDFSCRTVGFTVVVNTVFDVTDNALDVVAATASTLRIVHDVYHSLFFVSSRRPPLCLAADHAFFAFGVREYVASLGATHSHADSVCGCTGFMCRVRWEVF